MVLTLTDTEVGRQLIAAGVLSHLYELELFPTSVRGWSYPALLFALRADPRVVEGMLHGLHPEVGEVRTDFRSYRGTFGKGSLQIVVDCRTGRFYADVDQWNPYADVVNWVGHAGEVIAGWWRRWRNG